MYTPRAFFETDLTLLDGLIAADPFVTLITVADSNAHATQLPVLYRRDAQTVLIEGHSDRLAASPNQRERDLAALMHATLHDTTRED